MKIIEINFTNINNLRGTHKVSFQELPLRDVGIFAILGPTGSGKSTLLDVITLALFNEIPRFKKSISKNEMITQGSVITHHTDDAQASIHYEINGQSYISKWSVSKTKKGKLKDYEMTLQKGDGQYYDLKKSEVPKKNESIIGLKYDQFVKAIILSQGEFSKFLKADKNERGQLLENLTGTHIYRKIGEQAFLKHREVKASVDDQLQRMEEIVILTEEDRTELTKKIKEKEEEQVRLDKNIEVLRKQKTIKESLNKLTKNLQDKNNEEKILNIKIEKFSSKLLKLQQHEKVLPLKSDIDAYKQTKVIAHKTKENLENYQAEMKHAEEGLHNTIRKMSVLTKKPVNKDNFKNVMTAFEDNVKKLVNERDNNKLKGEDLRKRINDLKSEYTYPLSQHPDQALNELLIQEEDKKNIIKKAGINTESNIKTNTNHLSNLKRSRENYQALNNLSLSKVEFQKNILAKEAEIKELKPLIKKASETLHDTEVKLKDKIQIETLLQKQMEDALKIASLEKHRHNLSDGEACPLCGSTEHPYTSHLPEKKQSEISKEIAAAKSEVNKIRELKSTLTEQKSSAETKLELNIRDVSLLKKNEKTKEEEIKHLLEDHPELIANRDNIETILEELSEKIVLLEAAIEALREMKQIQALRKEHQELKSIIIIHKEIVAKKNELYEGDNPSDECNELQDSFTNFDKSIDENNKAISRETKDLVRANDLLDLASVKLTPHLSLLDINSIEELSNLLLDNTTLSAYKEEETSINKSTNKVKTEIETFRNQINELKSNDISRILLSGIIDELDKKQITRDNLIKETQDIKAKIKLDEENQLKKNKKEEEISKLQKELGKWALLNKLIGDSLGNKFSNFAQGLTLQNLLVYTNKRLKYLSDRYILDKPVDDGPLRVVDLYQGNIERGVNTLSGGETFLISLALALSLSDMASRNVSLDSLFIDEGFGTLDQETLEIALNTLEKLQSESQKTVAVISHVEALKERINVQILLEKNAQGYSKLKIVS